LSAFPSGITLPDPDLHSSDLEDISEMNRVPPVLSDATIAFRDSDIRALLDQVLSPRSTPALLASLKDALVVAPPEGSNEVSYNVGLINAVVMYVGTTSVAQAKSAGGAAVFIASNPGPVALQYLATNFEPEGQYLLLSAMVIHLRYPNAHTHWFSSMMLDLFLQVKDDRLGEIVTRVLLERFIVHRPHPWGALATFIELLRNPKYDFASQEFTRSSREVTMLLNNVATAVLQS
jgi:CCR4-NOT transcription complex subunit 1